MKVLRVLRSTILTMLPFATLAQAETIGNDLIRVTVQQGRYAIEAQGQSVPFASGALRLQGTMDVARLHDSVFGEGQAISVTAADGAGESFQIFPGLPFVLHRARLVNTRTAATVLNKVPLMDAELELGKPAGPIGGPRHGRSQASRTNWRQLRLDGGGRSRHARGSGRRLADA